LADHCETATQWSKMISDTSAGPVLSPLTLLRINSAEGLSTGFGLQIAE
jgi:hypothetical protein